MPARARTPPGRAQVGARARPAMDDRPRDRLRDGVLLREHGQVRRLGSRRHRRGHRRPLRGRHAVVRRDRRAALDALREHARGSQEGRRVGSSLSRRRAQGRSPLRDRRGRNDHAVRPSHARRVDAELYRRHQARGGARSRGGASGRRSQQRPVEATASRSRRQDDLGDGERGKDRGARAGMRERRQGGRAPGVVAHQAHHRCARPHPRVSGGSGGSGAVRCRCARR